MPPWVPCGPAVLPGRFVETFRSHLGVMSDAKSMKCWVEFRCVSGTRFGLVLECFRDCFGKLVGAKRMRKRKRNDLWNCLLPLNNTAVLKGSDSIWGAKKKGKQSGTLSWMQSRFCLHFGSIWGDIWESRKRQNSDVDIELGLHAFWGPATRLSETLELPWR